MLTHLLEASHDFCLGYFFLDSDLALVSDSADSYSIGSVYTLVVGFIAVLVADSMVETSALDFDAEIFVPNSVAGSGSLGGHTDTDIL